MKLARFELFRVPTLRPQENRKTAFFKHGIRRISEWLLFLDTRENESFALLISQLPVTHATVLPQEARPPLASEMRQNKPMQRSGDKRCWFAINFTYCRSLMGVVISLERRTPNFDYQRLAKAIATRDHSYRLLMWISDAIGKGLIQPSRVAHLQAKKLHARDKRRADFLMCESVAELAKENDLDLDDALAERIVTDENTRRAAAFITYGNWLIRRLSGESDGPAILALWRLIAWDPRGGMRRGFTLQLEDFKIAEKSLLSTIQNAK